MHLSPVVLLLYPDKCLYKNRGACLPARETCHQCIEYSPCTFSRVGPADDAGYVLQTWQSLCPGF